jgi:hypothetical protein
MSRIQFHRQAGAHEKNDQRLQGQKPFNVLTIIPHWKVICFVTRPTRTRKYAANLGKPRLPTLYPRPRSADSSNRCSRQYGKAIGLRSNCGDAPASEWAHAGSPRRWRMFLYNYVQHPNTRNGKISPRKRSADSPARFKPLERETGTRSG